MAQDDYYYEIQLTNKQLVFYFMAGATGLILSFLAGVMVGRGVDASAGEIQAKSVQEDRVIAEQPPPTTSPATLDYAQRLTAEKVEDSLERSKPAGEPGTTAKAAVTTAKPAPAKPAARASTGPKGSPGPKSPGPEASTGPKAPLGPEASAGPKPPPSVAAPRVSPSPSPAILKSPQAASPGPGPVSGTFAIQVGAFKDRASAESLVSRLKAKGFAAYIVSPDGSDGGLFNVRVGSYSARADAERVEARLRDEEKFKPFIVHH